MSKAQIREIGSIAVVVILIGGIMYVLNPLLKTLSSGNIIATPDALVNALIPLIIFAIFFEIIRRLFK